MADIRIKDLTTTASSTASDDFFAVDGTTNGTRKLNAYSPSFGGNTTVAGTLAVNGGDVSASRFAVAAPSNTITGNFTAGSTSNQSFGLRVYAGTSATDYALKIRNVADTLTLLNVDGVGTVSIGATTASTSTSTGALVVSGGVGVAGAINAGGDSTINGTLTSNKNIAAGSLTAGSAANLIATSKVLSSSTLNSSIVMVAVSGSDGVDGGYCGYYMLNLVRQFGTYSVTVISSALPHNTSSGYSFTWSLDANYLKVTPGKTATLNYNYFTLTGSQTA